MEAAAGPHLSASADLRWRPLALSAIVLVGQALLALWLPAFADEDYYLAWAADPGRGYFDHPPAIAWWIAAGFGWPRLSGLVLMPVALGLLADAGRRAGLTRWAWIPLLVQLTPLGLTWPLVATPDTPLLFAWSVLIHGVISGRVVQVALGLAACLWAKSVVLLALPGLWWALGLRRSMIVTALAAALYSPHILWSLDHEGLPWTFQAGRAWTGFALPEALAGQIALVGPAVAWAAWRSWRARLGTPGPRGQLVALSLPILVAWLGLSLVTRVEANWPALAWPAAAILAVDQASRPRWLAASALWTGLAAAGAMWWLSQLPATVGPERDGPVLAACLQTVSEGPWVAGRYQDKAMLDAAGLSMGWRRAEGRRRSQYDLRSLERPPACGFVYLGPAAALGEGCAGGTLEGWACHRPITWCTCSKRKTPEP